MSSPSFLGHMCPLARIECWFILALTHWDMPRVCIPALSLSGCAISVKLLGLSEPSHLCNRVMMALAPQRTCTSVMIIKDQIGRMAAVGALGSNGSMLGKVSKCGGGSVAPMPRPPLWSVVAGRSQLLPLVTDGAGPRSCPGGLWWEDGPCEPGWGASWSG